MSAEDLTPAISLVDDLAADSLDVVELGLALDAEWGVAIPERVLDAVRTYQDVIDAVVASLVPRSPEPVFGRARIIPATGGSVEVAGVLTPYAVEILVEGALRAGPGTRLEMEFPSVTEEAPLTAARSRLARLAAGGIEVSVRRAGEMTPPAA